MASAQKTPLSMAKGGRATSRSGASRPASTVHSGRTYSTPTFMSSAFLGAKLTSTALITSPSSLNHHATGNSTNRTTHAAAVVLASTPKTHRSAARPDAARATPEERRRANRAGRRRATAGTAGATGALEGGRAVEDVGGGG